MGHALFAIELDNCKSKQHSNLGCSNELSPNPQYVLPLSYLPTITSLSPLTQEWGARNWVGTHPLPPQLVDIFHLSTTQQLCVAWIRGIVTDSQLDNNNCRNWMVLHKLVSQFKNYMNNLLSVLKTVSETCAGIPLKDY